MKAWLPFLSSVWEWAFYAKVCSPFGLSYQSFFFFFQALQLLSLFTHNCQTCIYCFIRPSRRPTNTKTFNLTRQSQLTREVLSSALLEITAADNTEALTLMESGFEVLFAAERKGGCEGINGYHEGPSQGTWYALRNPQYHHIKRRQNPLLSPIMTTFHCV